jgi:hypothetical protein
MTFKILFKIVAGNNFCFIAALGKDHTEFVSITRLALQGKGWTRPVIAKAFVEVDNSFMHDLIDFFFCNVAAIHTAQSVFGIIQVCRMTVKGFMPDRFLPSFVNKNKQKKENDD